MSLAVHHSSAKSDWQTPDDALELVRSVWGPIRLDPCTVARRPRHREDAGVSRRHPGASGARGGVMSETTACDECAPNAEWEQTWRCCRCDALHVDDHGSMEPAVTWERHHLIGASRRRWIDAATSILPGWNGTPKELREALLGALADAERRGYERGVRKAAELCDAQYGGHPWAVGIRALLTSAEEEEEP